MHNSRPPNRLLAATKECLMLVITRRVGEKVRIGRDIEVMVSYVRDGRVRLAIKAPPEVLVARTELLDPKRVTK